MLEIKFIRENIELVKEGLEKRGYSTSILDSFQSKEEKRRKLIQEIDEARRERNKIQERINKGEMELIEKTKDLSEKIKYLEEIARDVEKEFDEILYSIPNIPHSSVPYGKTPEDNQEIKRWEKPKEFSFTPRPHWELGKNLGILDQERSVKLSSSRFSMFFGKGALLERALIFFMLDLHTKRHGYIEISPPFLVNSKTMTGTGQLPKFSDDLFKVDDSDLWLVPTAEVPLTNIHSDEILDGASLPILYTAYTPCFRKEAGSYGKETRGLIRQHQFDKVELVVITKQDDSYSYLETLTSNAEEVLKRLELPYRVVVLCTGDLGFSASKTYDIEVWMSGMGKYVEISSCSNFEDFQARRGNIKYRTKEGKTKYVHTLNGSGLAVGRTFAAILENYQTSDGKIIIPHALREYMEEEVIQ
ncbi:TPA: serine--tRNA ligase [bacterium]|nr:serine--tRNA ligase [bacterium]